LITGGAGFLGSHLAEILIARDCRVTVIDDESTGNAENLVGVRDHFNFHYIPGSVADKGLVRRTLVDVDEVYHLAAAEGTYLAATAPIHCIETTVYPTELLLLEIQRLAKTSHVVKLFLASSSAVYGRNFKEPLAEDDELVFGPFGEGQGSVGIAKALAESLALAYHRQHGVPVVVGRFFNVIGPRQTGEFGAVLPRFVDAALRGEPLTVYGNGRQRRAFAHVADIVETMHDLMNHPQAQGGTFNLGGEEAVSIGALAQRVVEIIRPGLAVEYRSLAEAFGEGFLEIPSSVPNLDRLRAVVGFKPSYTLDNIIREVVAIAKARARSA
jgi:UDP-glucose 4-epimerase